MEYQSPEFCLKCEESFQLTPQGHCWGISIKNCALMDQGTGKCLRCNFDFELMNEDLLCQKISRHINGCVQQSSSTRCHQCESELVLSEDHTECLDRSGFLEQIDPNCALNVISKPYCLNCAKGYQMIRLQGSDSQWRVDCKPC